jgi:hypothetical protein
MTPNEPILRRLAEWKPGDGRHVLNLASENGGWTLQLTADHNDQLGCLIWEVMLRRNSVPADADVAALRAWAERVASRVTGLLEILEVIEVDAPRQVAMLRSKEPARRDNELHYYEVLLKSAGEASVRRYRASRQADSRREQEAFALTHEALAKLALDLSGAR